MRGCLSLDGAVGYAARGDLSFPSSRPHQQKASIWPGNCSSNALDAKESPRVEMLDIRRILVLGLDSTHVHEQTRMRYVLRKATEEMKKYKPQGNEINLVSELLRKAL